MLLEGWTKTKLSSGFTSSREKGCQGLPTLSVTIYGGLVDRDSIDRKMDTNLDPNEHLLVRKGDIAYNMMRMWQGASGLAEHDALVSPAYVVLRAKKGMDPLFASYLFKLRRMIHQFWAYSYGLTDDRLRLYPKDFGMIPVILPPIGEQRRIAEILSTWDRAIAVQEQLVANARAQKKALMQTLLTGTKKRLPGFKGEWKMKLFKHVVSIDQDSLGQNTPPDFEFRYISLSDVSSGSIANNLPSHTFSEAPSRARRKLKLGDILMATVRPNLQAFARVQSAQSDCIASTGFSVLSAKRDHNADYVYHYLFSEHITGQIDALVVGSSYPAINSADVANLAIHCPEKAEQDAIAQVLNDSDETVISGETKLSILKREKSALMQQLLTGKRRVKVEANA
jgi:type I restriction enzyme, S subunit